MNTQKVRKKSKRQSEDPYRTSKDQQQGVGDRDQEMVSQDTSPRFQPDGEFKRVEPDCCLQLNEQDEIYLLQLPPSWAGASGEIQMPRALGDVGSCRDEAGNEFHVIEPPATAAAQMYVWAPGQTAQPSRVSRMLTFVSARGLKDFEIAPPAAEDRQDTDAKDPEIGPGKRKRSVGEKVTAAVEQPTMPGEEDDRKPKKSKKKKKKKQKEEP